MAAQPGNGKPAPTEPKNLAAADPMREDPLRPAPDMDAKEAESASPDHLREPDPLPALNRPIFETPHLPVTHTPTLHPGRVEAHVEAAIEEMRMRLGEMREFLKRFPHDVGGELGDLVNHLRGSLGVARPDPARDARRREEDAFVASRRRTEDLVETPTPERLQRRAEEDAGLATLRRIQDTSPRS